MNKILRRSIIGLIFLLFMTWALVPASVHAQVYGIPELDAYIKKTMKQWKVPGLAVALVKGDTVVYIKGYGVREIGKNQGVDENTVFPIGSASKAFTSTSIGLLVQDGKLSWDDPVIDRLKGFQMYDSWVTREITIRDLLCNRGGLSEVSEFLWYATDNDRDEIVRRLRYIKPESSFRSQYAYRNCMFLTAGQVVPAVTGMSWDAFVKERIFNPLGMTRSSTSVRDLQKLGNVAKPHMEMDGRIAPVPFRNIDNIGPAGSVNASIRDMSKWLRFQLNNGKLGGREIAEAAVIEETHRPHTPIPFNPGFKGVFPWGRQFNYCLSWVFIDYDGEPCVYHNGQIDGIYAVIGFLPEKKVGAVVLTNREGHHLSDVVFLRALDVLLERVPKDWNAIYMENRKKLEEKLAKALKGLEASRVQGTKPSLPLTAYAGMYENEVYGKVRISLEKNRLVLRLSSILVNDLSHWDYDTFRGTCRDRVAGARLGPTFFTFGINSQGKVSEMKMNDMMIFKRLTDSTAGKAK
ncbi:MAG: serine hydrolase [Planctomycetaceae bacterium]|nr:MAG: serine hydrolase [Planctomycetaceae bacterium]